MPPSETQTVQPRTSQQKKSLPSIDEIRKAIPAKCWEKSLPTSIFYLVLDFAILAAFYFAVPYVEKYGGWTGLLIWYWFIGMFGSSLFIIGHDCGHGTFSNYTWVNDFFGHVAHAPILAPYWPWQKSHHQHHSYTSHVEKDRGHPWITEEEDQGRDWLSKNFSKIPISGFLRWNPIYTVVGLPDGSHFWPYSKLFTSNTDRIKCVISGLACAACAAVAFHLCDYSVFNFIKYYYVPLLFQGLWLVMITYLQHQSETIEVYEEGNWNYVKGQVQTIDRTYGFGMDTAMHHITDGHVAHHFFFTKLPHYHLMEATEAIKKVLADYPGAYKHRTQLDFFFEYLRLNVKLDYLIGKGTGILMYNLPENVDKVKKTK